MDGAKSVKRRGILAAAGAVVAGLALKQASEPVRADDGQTMVVGGTYYASHLTGLTAKTDFADGYMFYADASGIGGTKRVFGLFGLGNASGEGLRGHGGPSGGDGVIAYGGANGGYGVLAYGGGANNYGIVAYGAGTGAGVYGTSGYYGTYGFGTNTGAYGNGSSYGTHGTTSSGVGALGLSNTGVGVRGTGAYGVVGTVTNYPNSIAVNASNTSTSGTGNYGVYATCDNGYGVFGVSNKAGFAGCTGGAYLAGTAAFAGGTTTAGAYAAYFTGPVNIDGPFSVNGTQRFTLKHADGTQRLVSAVSSPEAWVEDFGAGTLSGGRAAMQIDPDFAAIAELGSYYVFPVAQWDSKGLYVTNKTATGFEVHEQQGGTSGISFAYRIVAKPKDAGGKVTLLAKYESPNIAIPGVADLPKSPAPLDAPEPPLALKPAPPPVTPPSVASPNPAPPPRNAPNAPVATSVPAPAAVAPPTAATAAQPTVVPAPQAAPPSRP